MNEESVQEVTQVETPLDTVEQVAPLVEIAEQATPLVEIAEQATPLVEIAEQATPPSQPTSVESLDTNVPPTETPISVSRNNVVTQQIQAITDPVKVPAEGVKTRVTEEDVMRFIDRITYTKLGEKTTVCLCTLINGFEVVGTSGCVDAKNYNHEVGSKYALDMCVKEIWKLLGFELQCRLYCN